MYNGVLSVPEVDCSKRVIGLGKGGITVFSFVALKILLCHTRSRFRQLFMHSFEASKVS